MKLFVPDTHALYWYEFDDSRLSMSVEQIFKDAEAGIAMLVIHPIVLAEFYWVLKKQGLHSKYQAYVDFVRASRAYRFETITVADLLRLDDFAEISEMHDRLIAIAAVRLNAVMLTKDANIQSSNKVKCLW